MSTKEELQNRIKELEAALDERARMSDEANLFLQFAQASGQGLGMGTMEGKVVYMNPALCRMVGEAKLENARGKPFALYYPPEQQQRLQNEVMPAVMQKGQWIGELALVDSHGHVTPTLENFFLIRDQDGHPRYLADVITDLTERKQAEEKRLRQMGMAVEQTSDGVAITDLEGNIQFVNSAWARMHGYEAAELIGQSLSIFHTEEQLKKEAEPAIRQTMQTGSYQGEVGHKRRDGSTFPTWMTVNLLKNEQGDSVAIVGTTRDIAERKQIELALRQSEERFRDVALSTADWVWEVDAQGHYTYCSEKVYDLLGYTAEEMLGKTPFDFMLPEEVARIAPAFGAIVADKRPIVNLENWNARKDGQAVCLLTDGAPILDTEGNLLGYRGVDKDITERKQAEVELQKLAAVVKHSSELVNLATLDGKMIFLNEAGSHMLGIDPAEVSQYAIPQVISEAFVGKVQSEVLPALMERGAWEGELQYRNVKTGKLTDVHAMTFTIRDPNTGAPLYLANVSLDITERKRSEVALRENEERFRRFSDVTSEGLVFHEQGKIIDANMALISMFGYSQVSDVVGKGVLEFLAPESHETVLKHLRSDSTQPYEAIGIRKDGMLFPVEARGQIYEFQGRIIRVGAMRDITKQKQAEEERARLQQEIIEAQQHALKELSTPIIPVMDVPGAGSIIVMPLIGSIDTMRAKDITRTLLHGISEYRAKVVILDITGVPLVDSGVANHLNKTIQAARLKGARTIVTGVSDAVAETIVDLGIDWSGIETVRDLQTGLLAALGSLGIALGKLPKR